MDLSAEGVGFATDMIKRGNWCDARLNATYQGAGADALSPCGRRCMWPAVTGVCAHGVCLPAWRACACATCGCMARGRLLCLGCVHAMGVCVCVSRRPPQAPTPHDGKCPDIGAAISWRRALRPHQPHISLICCELVQSRCQDSRRWAPGPFFEIFSKRAYLWECFNKRARKQKKITLEENEWNNGEY
jgi:hypothetical protein